MSDIVTFGAVGDVAFTGETEERMVEHGCDWPFERVRHLLERADVLFGNMESVAIPGDYPEDEIDSAGMVSRIGGPEGAAALKRAGFDFMNLAANHVLDAGTVGMFHTRECLEAAGLATGGVGAKQAEARRLITLEKAGLRFGFLCYGEDSNYTLGTTGPCYAYYELDSVLADVAAARAAVDVLVVSIHADIEFMPTPSVPRLENSRRIARAGADIVLGHHPHVPQGVEMVGGSLIAHSLGNFVFNAHTSGYMKSHAPRTASSFVLLVEIGSGGDVAGFERVPCRIGEPPEQRPAPLEGAAAAEMLGHFDELDRHLADDEFLRDTWREVARRHLAIYIKRAAEYDLDRVLDELVGRLCLTAENRSWMEEVLAMGRESWARQAELRDEHHRPSRRFAKKG